MHSMFRNRFYEKSIDALDCIGKNIYSILDLSMSFKLTDNPYVSELFFFLVILRRENRWMSEQIRKEASKF